MSNPIQVCEFAVHTSGQDQVFRDPISIPLRSIASKVLDGQASTSTRLMVIL
jgi:hypothetical protein